MGIRGGRKAGGFKSFTPVSRSQGKSTSTPARKQQNPTQQAAAPATPGNKKPVTVYRVEGPDNQRLLINQGNAHVVKSFKSTETAGQANASKKQMDFQDRAFLNFGDRARADEFLAVRHQQGHTQTVMKSFKVPHDTFEAIRKSAVPENAARSRGNDQRPIHVDVNKGDNQFGLNWKSLQLLNATAIPGSARVVKTKPD